MDRLLELENVVVSHIDRRGTLGGAEAATEVLQKIGEKKETEGKEVKQQ
jgi:hypothetical protein